MTASASSMALELFCHLRRSKLNEQKSWGPSILKKIHENPTHEDDEEDPIEDWSSDHLALGPTQRRPGVE